MYGIHTILAYAAEVLGMQYFRRHMQCMGKRSPPFAACPHTTHSVLNTYLSTRNTITRSRPVTIDDQLPAPARMLPPEQQLKQTKALPAVSPPFPDRGHQNRALTWAGFEPAPLRIGALILRLRPLGHHARDGCATGESNPALLLGRQISSPLD